MNRKTFCLSAFIFFLSILVLSELKAQSDKLPEFSLTERNGIVFISWNNPFEDLTQLIIQRSTDSTKFFRSIMAMPDPTSLSNGYVDRKEGASSMYYRIFYVLPGGKYAFTAARKPIRIQENKLMAVSTNISVLPNPDNQSNSWDSFKKKKPVEMIGKRNDDRETNLNFKQIGVEKKTYFDPSAFIFSNEDGNLILLLPEAEKKQFELLVFKDDGTPLFKMKNIKERYLLIDKSNFYQSGWFKFELYEGNRIKEKNRFFIPPDSQ
jgi:hypothetical protein